ncbi:MAG TPA: TadE family protein [Candidatus Sulfotelmatobacter sp.]|nr:TadE family protein [Candidatus Sulfotelmatobacter sp.]
MIRALDGRGVERRAHWRGDEAAQLVEFAVALPLLVLFVVGIFDFSGAFTLKQRLTVLARDAARSAAGSPTTDVQAPSTLSGAPGSVIGAFETIDNNLLGTNLSDCAVNPIPVRSGLTWTYSSPASPTGCVTPGLTIIINRGYSFPPTGATAPGVTCQSQPLGGQMALIGTCVSIQYAFPWKFGRVANVLGRTTVLPPQVSAVAVALNEN